MHATTSSHIISRKEVSWDFDFSAGQRDGNRSKIRRKRWRKKLNTPVPCCRKRNLKPSLPLGAASAEVGNRQPETWGEKMRLPAGAAIESNLNAPNGGKSVGEKKGKWKRPRHTQPRRVGRVELFMYTRVRDVVSHNLVNNRKTMLDAGGECELCLCAILQYKQRTFGGAFGLKL